LHHALDFFTPQFISFILSGEKHQQQLQKYSAVLFLVHFPRAAHPLKANYIQQSVPIISFQRAALLLQSATACVYLSAVGRFCFAVFNFLCVHARERSLSVGVCFGSGAAQQALSVSSKLAIHLFWCAAKTTNTALQNWRAPLLPLDYTKATHFFFSW
jgi:hypothetical protein